MRASIQWGIVFILAYVFSGSGCTSRVNWTHKLDGYHEQLENVTVSYNMARVDDPVNQGKGPHNFEKFGESLSRTVPPTFTSAGIDASFVANPAELTTDGAGETGQRIVITPHTAAGSVRDTYTGQFRPISAGPSVDRSLIAFDVSVIDVAKRRRVWNGEFFLVDSVHGQYSEEVAAIFLNDVIQKLRDDGLIVSIARKGSKRQ